MDKYYTLTENGAIQFNTTGNCNLDLFASIGSCREMATSNPDILIKKFWEAYTENPINAIAILFWARAVRNGAGERKVFEVLIKEVCDYFPEFIIDNIASIVELGRWSDLKFIFNNSNVNIKNRIVSYWSDAIQNKNALACKWLPKNTELYKDVQTALTFTNAEMRRWVAKYSKTVEQQMCAKNWKEIDYSKIPSQALNLYKDAFLRNDKEHYIHDITTKKVNAGAIYPHEILWNYAKSTSSSYQRDAVVNETVEALWRVLPNYINKNMRFITVCDCSGSMCDQVGRFNALSIARALSIYCAEKLEGAWKDKAILFSSSPEFIDCSDCKTLAEKNNVYKQFDDCTNTNLEAVFELILDAAKTCKDKSTIPNTILVLSDMQMDANHGWYVSSRDMSFMESMRVKYKIAGIEFPSIIWWNLYETNTGFVDSKYDNVAFASGFNPKIMQAVFEGMKVEYSTEGEKKVKIDPMVVMNKALDSIMKIINFERLDTKIPEAFKGIQLNTTIGKSIRNAAKKVERSETFLERIQELNK